MSPTGRRCTSRSPAAPIATRYERSRIMADILASGSSALLAYQTALNTTSHNIANANTDGYSRPRVELTSRLGQGSGSGYVGAGVDGPSVQRITDGLVSARLTSSTYPYARKSVRAGQRGAGRVELGGRRNI